MTTPDARQTMKDWRNAKRKLIRSGSWYVRSSTYLLLIVPSIIITALPFEGVGGFLTWLLIGNIAQAILLVGFSAYSYRRFLKFDQEEKAIDLSHIPAQAEAYKLQEVINSKNEENRYYYASRMFQVAMFCCALLVGVSLTTVGLWRVSETVSASRSVSCDKKSGNEIIRCTQRKSDYNNGIFATIGGAFFLLFSTFPLVWSRQTKRAEKINEERIFDIAFERDIVSGAADDHSTKADKLLKLNELQLARYYNSNLRERNISIGAGFLCIFIGIAIILYGTYLIHGMNESGESTEKIITGVLSLFGSMLTGYIGAIYIKTNEASAKATSSFHERLVAGHKLYLGHSLVSKIEDKEKRDEAFLELAKKISST